MDLQSFEHSFLLEQFREFHGTVLRFKQQILSRPELAAPASPGVAAPEEGDQEGEVNELDAANLVPITGEESEGDGRAEGVEPPLTPERIRFELLSLMQRQGQEVIRRGEENEQRRFREIQFVMAVMADEVFLHLNWAGRDFWSHNMLEAGLFRTHNGGEQFFQNVEKLLKGRDPTRAEVMAAYLMALSLGFRGQHHGDAQADAESDPDTGMNARLRYYRMQLFAALFHRHPGIGDEAQLFPQTYAHTLSNLPTRSLPHLRPWLAAIGGVMLGYIVIAHIIWSRESETVATAIDRIQDARRHRPTMIPSKNLATPGQR